MKICVIFGGISTEHDVSVTSGISVIKNLNKEKYEIQPIYIDQKGEWYKYTKDVKEISDLTFGEKPKELEKIENIVKILENADVIFPVLHGIGGEDGSIQGLFTIINKRYVGCGILASSVGMDKVYTKIIFEKAGLNQAKYEYIRKSKKDYIYIDKNFNEEKCTLEKVCKKIEKNIKYPMFVKPSNSGSSVGINKAKNHKDLKKYIEYASEFDRKIIIEEEIKGKEVECAVLGNEEVIASNIGEIIPEEEFYSFDAKYNDVNSRTLIPARIPKKIAKEIRNEAIKAFKAIDGKGLSRVDFFVENETNKIYINEVNTLPGFTQISMYPKLFEEAGINYEKLLDKLIELSMNQCAIPTNPNL